MSWRHCDYENVSTGDCTKTDGRLAAKHHVKSPLSLLDRWACDGHLVTAVDAVQRKGGATHVQVYPA